MIGIATDFTVSPGEKLNSPERALKSEPAVAVPFEVW